MASLGGRLVKLLYLSHHTGIPEPLGANSYAARMRHPDRNFWLALQTLVGKVLSEVPLFCGHALLVFPAIWDRRNQ